MALPLLDAMLPTSALASSPSTAMARAAAAGQPLSPVRMGFIFQPNGFHMPDFLPKATGANYDMPRSLKPLEKVREHLTILSGLAHDNARAKGDGPGDHARSSAAFLTGAHPHKTNGRDIRLGVSIDQFAAQQIGKATPLPSLELGCDRGRMAGNCDSGYSCAYVTNISWANETTPIPQEVDPGAVFDRLFGGPEARRSAADRKKKLAYRKSVLDLVADDTRSLQRNLGQSDQRKLDEYMTAVRDVEQRVERAREDGGRQVDPGVPRPEGIPRDYADHIRLMYDMMALAFRTDMTRISTFMVARAGSNRSFPDVGVRSGHHRLSHHKGKQNMIEDIKKIDLWYMQQFAYFVERLGSIPEGEGTLLDNCMIMLGSGISDGNRHRHEDLPCILAGRGGGTIAPGRHVSYRKNTPLCNLYMSVLQRVGVKADRFGDSNGVLSGLTV